MIRVVQSAGRLLRSERDRGVIALYDRRFLREPYASLLPGDWLAGRPPEALVGDPVKVARAFFAHGCGSPPSRHADCGPAPSTHAERGRRELRRWPVHDPM
jgi:hypothetical protein